MANPVAFDGQRWSNADADRIAIVPPDPNWPAQFALEAAAIRAVLDSPKAVPIEHIGSTAVPGLAAKPIIDILLMAPVDWAQGTVVPVHMRAFKDQLATNHPTDARRVHAWERCLRG